MTYLHVVDTALWLADGRARLRGGALKITPQGEMLYAEHQFSSPRLQVTTSMHRRAGSQREWVQAVTDGGLYAVSEMREWQEECGHGVVQRPVAGWQTTLEQRGFLSAARAILSNACKIRRFLKLQANRRCWLSGSLRNCGATPLANNPL